jgi:hypothetical protein
MKAQTLEMEPRAVSVCQWLQIRITLMMSGSGSVSGQSEKRRIRVHHEDPKFPRLCQYLLAGQWGG